VTEQVREQVRKENTTKRVLRLFERVAKQIEKGPPYGFYRAYVRNLNWDSMMRSRGQSLHICYSLSLLSIFKK
jgi:hypothetical protein